MKILHMIDSLRVGGAQTHLYTMLVESIARFDADHEVLSLFDDGPVGTSIRELGVSVTVLGIGPDIRAGKVLSALRKVRSHITESRPMVMEAHLTYSRLLGGVTAWLNRVPVRVGFEQGDLYLCSPLWRVLNFVGQFTMQHIVVCSEWLKGWVHRTHGVARSKLRVYHNAVDLRKFRRANLGPKITPGDLGLHHDQVLFAAVGTLGRGIDKRVDVCIRALSSCRRRGANAALLIVGDGDKRESLKVLSSELGVAEHIAFLGMRSDVSSLLSLCRAFVHGADREPFGIVAVEAMAMELPVVVPDAGGICETVELNQTGFLYPPGDHEALGQTMKWLCDNPAEARTMGTNGRVRAEKLFEIGMYMDRLYQMYGVSHVGAREVTGGV